MLACNADLAQTIARAEQHWTQKVLHTRVAGVSCRRGVWRMKLASGGTILLSVRWTPVSRPHVSYEDLSGVVAWRGRAVQFGSRQELL